MEERRRYKVLVADDSEMNRSILTDMLCRDMDVVEAKDGSEVLEILHRDRKELALVLLDLMMPIMDGFWVLREMRKKGWDKEVPVIILAAEGRYDHIDQAYDLGAVDCIQRPFNDRVVRRRVINAITLYQQKKRLDEYSAERGCAKERANAMIAELLRGEYGTPEELLLDWLGDRQKSGRPDAAFWADAREMAREISLKRESTPSDRTLLLLDRERIKHHFFASLSNEIQFEYTVTPEVLTISEWGAHYLGISEIQVKPTTNPVIAQIMGPGTFLELGRLLRESGPDCPVVEHKCAIWVRGEKRLVKIVFRAMWSPGEHPEYLGAIGKVLDLHEEHSRIAALEQIAAHDGLTGLLNRESARAQIEILLAQRERKFALAVLDLDYFKEANDRRGHQFGDKVLKHVADKLHRSIRRGDLAARVGGDEFLVFLEYTDQAEGAAERIFRTLREDFEGFPISVSMGVARSPWSDGTYETLFRRADQALYNAKEKGRGCYCFFDDSMQSENSVLSPIESEQTE